MTATVFILDVKMPLGIGVGTMYCLTILCSWMYNYRFASLIVATVCSILIWVGYFCSFEPNPDSLFPILNRLISQFAVWLSAALVTGAKINLMRLKFAHDNLERKVFERTRELEKNQASLINKNKELEQFAYIASHDLQEPLRTVTSLTEMLGKKYGDSFDEKGIKIMGYITDASSRMRDLIKGLLDYSRLGKAAQLSEVDCNSMVGLIRSDLHTAIDESGAKLHVEHLPTLDAYELELRQLFQNLIVNAIKFRAPDSEPEITISAEENSGRWTFSVRDNGIGIDPSFHEKIFLIFQRLNSKDLFEGTGIGLANCHKIVTMHGGDIWVESEVGSGSTFHFTLGE